MKSTDPATANCYTPDKERAKCVLVEILRAADGHIGSTTELYKAFYIAHLWYASTSPGYLTDWPIVRMQRGPGIGNAHELIDELIRDGIIERRRKQEGPFNSNHYWLAKESPPGAGLNLDEIEAIASAVRWIKSKTPGQLIELTHEHSRSWNLAADGEELNIYVDLLDDAEFDRRLAASRENAAIVDEVWKERS